MFVWLAVDYIGCIGYIPKIHCQCITQCTTQCITFSKLDWFLSPSLLSQCASSSSRFGQEHTQSPTQAPTQSRAHSRAQLIVRYAERSRRMFKKRETDQRRLFALTHPHVILFFSTNFVSKLYPNLRHCLNGFKTEQFELKR